MSKGSAQRPDDGKYRDNWDRIFSKKNEDDKWLKTPLSKKELDSTNLKDKTIEPWDKNNE